MNTSHHIMLAERPSGLFKLQSEFLNGLIFMDQLITTPSAIFQHVKLQELQHWISFKVPFLDTFKTGNKTCPVFLDTYSAPETCCSFAMNPEQLQYKRITRVVKILEITCLCGCLLVRTLQDSRVCRFVDM